MARRHAALITGAAGGIGAALAERLARTGDLVILSGRRREGCEALAQRIRSRGGAAAAVELDVGDPDSILRGAGQAWVAAEAAGVEAIDWLVNNAGIALSAPLGALGEEGQDLYAEHMRINFHGARRVAEAFLADMRGRGYGRIVNLGSSAGLRGYRYAAAYCASKHALIGYTRAAAQELAGSGVAIGAVCPHYVDTPMTERSVRRIVAATERAEEDVRGYLARQNPGGRLVTPDEVAEAIAGLLQAGEEQASALVELDGTGEARVVERLGRGA